MIIVEFIQHIFVSILVGYLSLTHTLAGYVEELVIDDVQPTENVLIDDTTTYGVLPSIEKNDPLLTPPTVLLEHTAFQRASVIASTRDEQPVLFPSDIPLENVIENSLVNIYCQYKTDAYIRTTTGTGFFINPKGVILTNAHVAQFLLLEEADTTINDIDCVIRTGNPAVPKYKAKLLYISPTWIFENAELIDDEMPRGTGERDYALLYVAESTDSTPLPATFPALPTDTNLLSRGISGTTIFSAGYPAETLIRNGSDTELFPVIANATIGTLYTFGSNYADIFSISNSPVGEQGASGGPVVTSESRAIGLIVTKGDATYEGVHSLRALTLSYVDRTITEETGFSLTQNMLGDVAMRGHVFKDAIGPFLMQLLEDELAN